MLLYNQTQLLEHEQDSVMISLVSIEAVISTFSSLISSHHCSQSNSESTTWLHPGTQLLFIQPKLVTETFVKLTLSCMQNGKNNPTRGCLNAPKFLGNVLLFSWSFCRSLWDLLLPSGAFFNTAVCLSVPYSALN